MHPSRCTPHPDQRFGRHTFSQHGEDLFIASLFSLLQIERPSYLDLGAHHPWDISNTALLYERGSRGVNVEANINLIDAFKRERPEDKSVCAAVGALGGVSDFYMFSESSGRNTFSSREVDRVKTLFQVETVKPLPMVTLDELLDEYCQGIYPDFLNSDLEGLDFQVLSAVPKLTIGGSAERTEAPAFNAPKVICVETRYEDAAGMTRMLSEKGFMKVVRMGENLIFIRADLYFKIQ